MQLDRRAFVKTSSMAAVLGTTSLAGCSGLLGGGGDGGVDPGSWQYDPSQLGSSPNVFFGSMDWGTLYANRDELPESMQEDFESSEDTQVDPADVDKLITVGGGEVGATMQSMSLFGSFAITGQFNEDDLIADIESGGDATQIGEYQGYTLYEVSSVQDASAVGGVGNQPFGESATAAAGEEAMIVGFGVSQNHDETVTGRQTVETMIDASNGDASLITDTSGPAPDLQGRIGGSTMSVGAEFDPVIVSVAEDLARGFLTGGSGENPAQYIGGIRAAGLGADIDGDTTTGNGVLIYESESRATETGIADRADEFESAFRQQPGVEEVTIEQDGAVITLTVTGDTETLAQQGESAGGMASISPRPY